MSKKFIDQDPNGTLEWLEAFDAMVAVEGNEKAHHVLDLLINQARQHSISKPYSATTPYINTIPSSAQKPCPAFNEVERKLRSIIRWNAMVMVVRANRFASELGGHIASFASSASLYEVGFNHFYKGSASGHEGDLIFFQGHSSPGIYSRAFLEGRLTEEQLCNFRQEVGQSGLSSYPHPWLMPDFWQFPTVSMGLGPIMAIYQARFMKYLQNRQLLPQQNRKVWAYLGDGEMDEPESIGAIALASREILDNLIFVINCNLQRLDGPVRGNGKIIQELEGEFRGAGWNVIKVIWGTGWDYLLEKDHTGKLQQLMMEVSDGDYQTYKSKDGRYVREHFFGRYPETLQLVEHLSDQEIFLLTRGGHDVAKIYTAYQQAVQHQGQPTVILAKTVKGYGMMGAGQGENTAHQQKKLPTDVIRRFRDRFNIPIADQDLEDIPFYRPSEDSEEIQYLHQQRKKLGGYLPIRQYDQTKPLLKIPDFSIFDALMQDSGERSFSTTMAYVRLISTLLRHADLKQHLVPIVPDEARTFGMEGLFRQIGIYSPHGQQYTPADSEQMMWYKESATGQILEEGINEAGAMSSWIAAGTAYTNHGLPMIPFYIYYSMFGYQRIGDLVWAAADMQAKGFLLGATAGRTTLAGEGLQHQDGHHQLMFGHVPNCRTYDPTFAYELAIIMHDGMKRMYEKNENCFYYISLMNENYHHPAPAKNIYDDVIQGLYLLQTVGERKKPQIQLLGSGTILVEIIAAAKLLLKDWGIASLVWSAPSLNNLRIDGHDCERWNLLNSTAKKRIPFVTQKLDPKLPTVAATDYVKAYAEQIRAFVPNHYSVLGTDGFGRSDTRKKLRQFFEVDRYWIVLQCVYDLAKQKTIPQKTVQAVIQQYKIDTDKPNPLQC